MLGCSVGHLFLVLYYVERSKSIKLCSTSISTNLILLITCYDTGFITGVILVCGHSVHILCCSQ